MPLCCAQTAVGDVIVMNIYRSDVGRCVAANTRALKSIFTQKLHAGSATADEHGDTLTQHKTLPLIVAVHDCDATADNSSLAVSALVYVIVWRDFTFRLLSNK